MHERYHTQSDFGMVVNKKVALTTTAKQGNQCRACVMGKKEQPASIKKKRKEGY